MWFSKRFFLIFFIFLLLPTLSNAQGLRLKLKIPKDSSSVKTSSQRYRYHLKLTLPDTIIEIKNDTLKNNIDKIHHQKTFLDSLKQKLKKRLKLLNFLDDPSSIGLLNINSDIGSFYLTKIHPFKATTKLYSSYLKINDPNLTRLIQETYSPV